MTVYIQRPVVSHSEILSSDVTYTVAMETALTHVCFGDRGSLYITEINVFFFFFIL